MTYIERKNIMGWFCLIFIIVKISIDAMRRIGANAVANGVVKLTDKK
jgi:hypothetical protein